MSDHWEFFLCQMGESQASIFFDAGIADEINELPCDMLVKVRVRVKEPNDNGMPTNAEFESLVAVEDHIETWIKKAGGAYVGRVTVDGWRHFRLFAPSSHIDTDSLVATLAREHEYEAHAVSEPDPDKTGYWEDLYPTDQDWQIIGDQKVIEQLEKGGDDLQTPREIHHWVYFESSAARSDFKTWALNEGFKFEKDLEPDAENPRWGVILFHIGTPKLGDITHYTLALFNKAKGQGAEYDGWETSVERPGS